MGRAPCCDKANVKKGPWSPEEDATLKDYLEKHGTGGNWIALPHKAGLSFHVISPFLMISFPLNMMYFLFLVPFLFPSSTITNIMTNISSSFYERFLETLLP